MSGKHFKCQTKVIANIRERREIILLIFFLDIFHPLNDCHDEAFEAVKGGWVVKVVELDSHLYIYIFVHLYICIFVCLHVCMFVYLYTCKFVYLYILKLEYSFICIFLHVVDSHLS